MIYFYIKNKQKIIIMNKIIILHLHDPITHRLSTVLT